MRGLPYWNFPAFQDAAQQLQVNGWAIHSPAEHDLAMGLIPVEDGTVDFPVSACLDWDFKKIAESSCVITLPGWETSTGCHWELTVAHALGKPVFQYAELTPVELPDVVTNPTGAVIVKPEETLAQASYAHMRGVDGPGAWSREGSGRLQEAVFEGPGVFLPDGDNDFRPPIATGEVRVVDPKTGGAKGSKPCQMGALDPVGLEQMGLVAGMGSIKYDRFNFLKGYKWSLSVDALYRHLLSFLAGEDNDPESGLPHMAHAAWHAHALTGFLKRGIGTDDRPT